MPVLNKAISTPTKQRVRTKTVYIESPAASDVFTFAFVPDAVTLVQVRAVTDTGTVDFNVERRATDTPDVAGTDILSSDLQATAAGANTTTFDNGGAVGAEQWLAFVASAVASSPTKLWVMVEYTVD